MAHTHNGTLLSHKKFEILLFTTWMELEVSVLNGISQQQKDKYHAISLICGALKKLIHRTKGWGEKKRGRDGKAQLIGTRLLLDRTKKFGVLLYSKVMIYNVNLLGISLENRIFGCFHCKEMKMLQMLNILPWLYTT